MLARLATNFYHTLSSIENHVVLLLGRIYRPDAFTVLGIENDTSRNKISKVPHFSIEDILKDSILWAVPKHRRTVEKRLQRKFGWPHPGVWKPLTPKKNLIMCRSCGDHHEIGYLCRTCYSKVKIETEEMKNTIEAELKLDPVDKEVVVLYQGEKEGLTEEFFEGKRIIEMKKERPVWFSKNLLEKTTQAPATTTSVKPTDLA